MTTSHLRGVWWKLVTAFNVFYFYHHHHHHIFVIITVIVVIIIDTIVIIIISNIIIFTIIIILHCTWHTYDKLRSSNINIYKTSSKDLFRNICSNVICNYLWIDYLIEIWCLMLSSNFLLQWYMQKDIVLVSFRCVSYFSYHIV